MLEDIVWSQKYRPNRVKDIILPAGVQSVIEGILEAGEVPNITFASSSPGTGKTTTALALVDELGHDYILVNGSSSEERGIAMVSNVIKPFATSMSLNGRKVVILDEADQLTPDAQKALRHVIEEVSKNCSFVLTCNYKNRLEDAILSRCTPLEFSYSKEEEKNVKIRMFKRVLGILKKEGFELDKVVIRDIINSTFPDFRNIINKIQYVAEGRGDAASFVGSYDVAEIVKILRKKDYDAAIDWVSENVTDPLTLILDLSEYDGWEPYEFVVVTLVLNKAQDRHTRVPDTWLNLHATLFEIMEGIG